MELTCEPMFWRGVVAGVAGTIAFFACVGLVVTHVAGSIEADARRELGSDDLA